MYDCLHLRFTLRPKEPGYGAFQASLALRLGTRTRQEPTRWQLRYRGLRLDYWPQTGRGRIRGSLHTFFHGHNSGSFLAAEVSVASQQLANAFGLPAHVLEVERLEVGVNLPLPTAPTRFLDSLLVHKGSRFYPQEPPVGTSRPLLFVATHLDYRVKAYDKGKYNRVQGTTIRHTPPHLLRFEVAYTRARPLQRLLQCTTLTLETIALPAAVQQLAQALRQHWYDVEHQFEPDFSGLDFQDMLLLHAATAPTLWQAARQIVPARTLSRHRAKSRQLRQLAEHSSPLATYHQRFEQQMACLLAGANETEALTETTSRDLREQELILPANQQWPMFHPCNQVEPPPATLVDASHISCPFQPAPYVDYHGLVHATSYFGQLVDMPIFSRATLLSRVLVENTATHPTPYHHPCTPYLSSIFRPAYALAKIELKKASHFICPPHQLIDASTITSFYYPYILLTYNTLHHNVAIKRIRPPPSY
ncbi:hypothetical protein MTX78_19715 [Hymenobacter tibetensis]|uniref:Uncharacterized protein n=1 Tax=Hymenobacter tibetensis TaxID=497967 RepID=A0ABY4D304_9BACT|nr:hypothetical protein [Hymenobacter tibetensis]UOG74333.1 hypothetical protein MTX78_19715 [Hymenobacter tibetensis]